MLFWEAVKQCIRKTMFEPALSEYSVKTTTT